jgi:hypothetical protein
MGYKKIMHLPDFPKSGCRTSKPETQEGSSGKFLPADGFSEPGLHGVSGFLSWMLPGSIHSCLPFCVTLL